MTSICPIIPALFLVLLASYYSQNYAGILASPLAMIHTPIKIILLVVIHSSKNKMEKVDGFAVVFDGI